MFSSQYTYNDYDDEVPKKKLCINSDEEFEQEQQQQHQVIVPLNTEQINDSHQLYHEGQKKVFTLSVVTLWLFQILIELVILINMGLSIHVGILYTCIFTAILILIFTIYENHPLNKMQNVSFQDQILFMVYFLADIFTDFAIYAIISSPELFFFIIIFRIYQFGNLVCSMYTLVQTIKQIQIKGIIIITFIPFGILILFAYWIDQWRRNAETAYLIPVSWQIVQFVLTFNLIRAINEIYSQENKKIDIKNIYTGFILFKYSYYIPY